MPRYVDADEMIDNTKRMKDMVGFDAIEIDGIIDYLNKHAVDSAHIACHAHGELESDKACENLILRRFVCSHCGIKTGADYAYCPHCGSVMD